MSLPKPSTAEPEQSLSTTNGQLQPLKACDPVRVPESFTKRQLAERLQISLSSFDRLRHRHPAIKQLDGPGHPRFCVKTYRRWIDSGAPMTSSFVQSRKRAG